MPPTTNRIAATSESFQLHKFQLEKRSVRFLFSWSEEDMGGRHTYVNGVKKWKSILHEGGYETPRFYYQSKAEHLHLALQDPSAVAVIWGSHGGSAGRLFVASQWNTIIEPGPGAIIEHHYNLIRRRTGRFVNSVSIDPNTGNPVGPPTRVPEEIEVQIDGKKEYPINKSLIGKYLRFVVLYGCQVASTNDAIAGLANQGWPVHWFPYFVGGKKLWEELLQVPVYAVTSTTTLADAIDPYQNSAPQWQRWQDDSRSFDWNDLDLERTDLLGGLEDRIQGNGRTLKTIIQERTAAGTQ